MTRLLPLALLLCGCGSQVAATLAEEWEVTVDAERGSDLRVVDYLPADGIVGVAHRSSPYFLFNRPMTAQESADLGDLTLAEADGGAQFTFAPQVAFDDAAVTYGDDVLNRPEPYVVDVQLPGGPFHSAFATDEPPGPDFNIAQDLSVTAFGGNSDHAATLASYFTPGSPVWLAKVTGLGTALPATVDIALAVTDGASTNGRPFYIHRQYGYITRFAGVTVTTAGAFEATLEGAFLPLWISGDPVLLRLTPLTVRGRFDLSGAEPTLADFELHGVVDTRSLLKMADLPEPWPRLLDIVELDVDTNGNDVPDSATIHLESQPALVPRDQIDFG